MARKGENIYKRKDKRWEARYIKGHHLDGRIQYGYCYGKTYHEVKEKVAKAKAALLYQIPDDKKKDNTILQCYCDEWLLFNRSRVKDSTYVKYCNIVEKHIKPSIGNCKINNLSSIKVEQFSNELLTQKKLSSKTVKDILIVLHSILKYASKQNLSQLSNIEISYPKEHKKEMRVLSKEEQKQFIQYLSQETDKYKFGILLALFTGMRIGEVCALRWQDISFREKTIHVSHTIQRLKNLDVNQSNKTKVVISEPKSDHSMRLIPMTDFIVQLCERFVTKEQEAFVLTGSKECYIEPRTLQNQFKRCVAECGLENVHFHTLRHTFATRCVEVEFEIKSLSEILGHSSPRVTLERYVHSSLELKRENMKKLEKLEL